MRIRKKNIGSLPEILGAIARFGADVGIREFVSLTKSKSDTERTLILIEVADRIGSSLFSPNLAIDPGFVSGLKGVFKTPIDIATDYQYLVSNKKRREKGVFFTPPWLAESVLKEALVFSSSPRSILDPACGSGIFLLYALKYIKASIGSLSPSSLLKEASQILYGVDIDNESVLIARLLLTISAFEGLSDDGKPLNAFSRSIIQGNSIEDTLSRFDGESTYAQTFPDVFGGGGFDLVVGNPPFGLKRNGCATQGEVSSRKLKYEGLNLGKANNYMVFIARGYELLKQGGVLSFVTPNSWLGIKDGETLRTIFLSRGEFRKISVQPSNAFNDASLECVTFALQKGARSTSIEVERADTGEKSIITTKNCLFAPNAVIPLSWNGEIEELLNTICQDTAPLGSELFGFDPKIALQIYAEGKGTPPQTSKIVASHAFHSKGESRTSTSKRYLEGKGLKRYELSWGGEYVEYGPWCAEYQPLDRFSQPRLLIREITGKPPYLLQCSYTEEELLYNRSVLHVLSKQTSEFKKRESLLALLGILNSKLASFIILFRGQKSQRKIFPKILNGDLKSFPLPLNFFDNSLSISNLVERRLDSPDLKLEEEIDLEVLRAYGVTPGQFSGMEWALNSLCFTPSQLKAA